MNVRLFAVACAASVLLAACATQPRPLQGEFNPITPRDAAQQESTGAVVRWGGRIDGYENRRIGGYDYRFPHVAADVVYLWPIRERVNVVTRPAPWPWWGWW